MREPMSQSNSSTYVPNFATMNLVSANALAYLANVVLAYFNQRGDRVAAPQQSDWAGILVIQNIAPPAVGAQVAPGTQVGVMI